MYNLNFKTMKKISNSGLTGLFLSLFLMLASALHGQSEKAAINKYLGELPDVPVNNQLQKYRMTAVYTNRDLYGNFTGKTKVTGDYTMGLENGNVVWNNVLFSVSDKFDEPFPLGKKLEYAENFIYLPTYKMLEPASFKNFPNTPEAVFAKNLVWDMLAIDEFGLKHKDSLKLNKIYRIRDTGGKFDMAAIGNYTNTEIQLIWTGISAFDDEICAVIEHRAIDNMIELDMPGIKSKGTEQYWGTSWISLKTGLIVHAEMYSGTIQEIEIDGMKDKFLVKTIRELRLDKMQ